ncbi:MAG TPA: putative glycolipid-binding domain-containing protein [Acidimicrobiales bacterium]|nr:putative glycolipid-binding domain-containing protein [Acidimicrobiales bacterium]
MRDWSVPFDSPPATACWRHQGLRSGFEVVYFGAEPEGVRVEGTTAGIQDDDTWTVSYELELDAGWSTRRARIATRTVSGRVERLVESDSAGHWFIDGVEAVHLEGCRDIDLESSALTNALPVHRLGLAVGQSAGAPAAYVRSATASIERLDQVYARVEDEGPGQRYDYEAPTFDFRCRLVYDRAGLVLDYPGIAVRAG